MQRSNSRRAIQMGDQIMQVLASLLIQEAEDPNLALVTITGVRLNRDFSIAEVLYTHIRGRTAEPEITKALYHAKGFLRSRLSKELNLRGIPDLRFKWDTFLEDMVYDAPPETDN
ncbi:MAG: ribosome-binding factor A [Deltaproteobacteria bacterium HGW-Deltaproteobacteria-18]|nr:MAG: ribosome-binding factor A [Deltaproteobacteria bacterium HGW-Deltaproteobacteria-18]